MFPVAAATGSLCAQTHIPYVAVCGGIGLFALVRFALFWARAARRGSGRAYMPPFVGAVAAVAVVWAPPIIDQLSNTPGNISLLLDYFRSSHEPTIGGRAAAPILLAHLDAIHLVIQSFVDPASFTRFM